MELPRPRYVELPSIKIRNKFFHTIDINNSYPKKVLNVNVRGRVGGQIVYIITRFSCRFHGMDHQDILDLTICTSYHSIIRWRLSLN